MGEIVGLSVNTCIFCGHTPYISSGSGRHEKPYYSASCGDWKEGQGHYIRLTDWDLNDLVERWNTLNERRD